MSEANVSCCAFCACARVGLVEDAEVRVAVRRDLVLAAHHGVDLGPGRVSISASERAWQVMVWTLVMPNRRRMAVVTGTYTPSSGLRKPCPPLERSRPMTWKLWPAMRMVLPTGDWPSNRFGRRLGAEHRHALQGFDVRGREDSGPPGPGGC